MYNLIWSHNEIHVHDALHRPKEYDLEECSPRTTCAQTFVTETVVGNTSISAERNGLLCCCHCPRICHQVEEVGAVRDRRNEPEEEYDSFSCRQSRHSLYEMVSVHGCSLHTLLGDGHNRAAGDCSLWADDDRGLDSSCRRSPLEDGGHDLGLSCRRSLSEDGDHSPFLCRCNPWEGNDRSLWVGNDRSLFPCHCNPWEGSDRSLLAGSGHFDRDRSDCLLLLLHNEVEESAVCEVDQTAPLGFSFHQVQFRPNP